MRSRGCFPTQRGGRDPAPTTMRPEVSAISTTSLALSTSTLSSAKSDKLEDSFFDLSKPAAMQPRGYSPGPTSRRKPEPTMARPEFSAISTTAPTRPAVKKCKKSKQQFFDLPPTLRGQLITMSTSLTQHLNTLIASGQLRATDVLPIGSKILDLTSLCCRIKNRELPTTTPHQIDYCACCEVLDLMDLDGEVLHSFPDDGDDAVVEWEVQRAAMVVIDAQARRALGAVREVLAVEEKGGFGGGLRWMFVRRK